MSGTFLVVLSNFFSFYICAFYSNGHHQSTQTHQWVARFQLNQSMWTLHRETWLLSVLTHRDILGWAFTVL